MEERIRGEQKSRDHVLLGMVMAGDKFLNE
jgi:hypothetical protein